MGLDLGRKGDYALRAMIELAPRQGRGPHRAWGSALEALAASLACTTLDAVVT